MKEFINKTCILWDFDGVILDSMEVREDGFRKVLTLFPASQIEILLSFHRKNGGLSRYVKFEYFLEQIIGGEKNEEKVQQWAEEFSEIMRKSLTSKGRLIEEVISFIKRNKKLYHMHIVSGSDGNELRFLCDQLEITEYFKSIHGSPTPKIDLVRILMEEKGYKPEETCLIGDSINDFEASRLNDIQFFGYNNPALKARGLNYINSFK
jgi:phosphoglycolate phosphatase-like HAD superfamily hydrolase